MKEFFTKAIEEIILMYDNNVVALKSIAFCIILLVLIIMAIASPFIHFILGGFILYFATDNIVDCGVAYLKSKANEKTG